MLQLNSQITLKQGQVKAFVNNIGDTLITIRFDDAKLILTDIINYQITDSLIELYQLKDIENSKIISAQKEIILNLNNKILNHETINYNLETIVKNKDEEIKLKNDIIKKQKNEIRRQKLLKIGGFSSAIILPALLLLLIK